jgi:hypothetical protein
MVLMIVRASLVLAVETSTSNKSTRGKFMKSNLIAAAVVAALTLPGLAAHAACVDPKSASQLAAGQQVAPLNLDEESLPARSAATVEEKIVGTWYVAYTTEGSPSGNAFIQWHRDGTEWENISFPVLGGNICLGSWKVVDEWHVSRNHWGWLFNDGVIAGYFNEKETDSLAWGGNSYSGWNETTFYDLTGKVTMKLSGTAKATRIAP